LQLDLLYLREAKVSKDVRTEWVDYAKAIGIILVVYGHVARGVKESGFNLSEPLFTLVDSIIYSFHMPLFFFLSGLFFYQSFLKRGLLNLTLNKVDTIVYPYIAWTLIQGGVSVLLSNYTNSDTTLQEVLSFWQPFAQFWFLYTLFILFVFCGLIYKIWPERFSVLLLFFCAILYIERSSLPNISVLFSVAGSLVFFVFGIVFSHYKCSLFLKARWMFLATSLLFIVSQYWFHIYLGKTFIDKGAESLFVAFLSIFFVSCLSIHLSEKPSKVIVFIGTSSMAIYVMHILTGSGARVFLSKVFGITSTSLHLVAGVAAGILLPLLAVKIIEKWGIPYVFSAPISKLVLKNKN
jgi:fucose 4-O-acetylase-like acetyltransferase